MAKSEDEEPPLKRLGGGRWQTRDERFTIEPQSGTWVVVDAEQADELGLPLVRGPFGSLGGAKDAIANARAAPPTESPLTARIDHAPPATETTGRSKSRRPSKRGAQAAARAAPDVRIGKDHGTAAATEPAAPLAPELPKWVTELDGEDRRRATRLITALADAGASDPEGIARRDIVGQVPAAAAFALERAIAALGPDASPAAVARLVADGRDDDLRVRWRIVDVDGRSILLDLDR